MVIFSVDFVDFEYDIRNFVKGWRKVDMDGNIIILSNVLVFVLVFFYILIIFLIYKKCLV